MTEPETENKKELPSIKRIIDALDLALIGLDEVSDEYRKRAFVGLVSSQDLVELYLFLKEATDSRAARRAEWNALNGKDASELLTWAYRAGLLPP